MNPSRTPLSGGWKAKINMALPVSSIGSQQFVRLSLPGGRNDGVETEYQHGNLVQRDGVDGTAFVQTGIKGDTFQLESFVDVATFADAQMLRMAYKSLVGTSNPVVVIITNLNYYTEHGHKYIVLDVKATAAKLGGSTGCLCVDGTGTPSPGNPAYARVDATWTLVPIFVGFSSSSSSSSS